MIQGKEGNVGHSTTGALALSQHTASAAASKAFILCYPRRREKEIALNKKLHFYLQKTQTKTNSLLLHPTYCSWSIPCNRGKLYSWVCFSTKVVEMRISAFHQQQVSPNHISKNNCCQLALSSLSKTSRWLLKGKLYWKLQRSGETFAPAVQTAILNWRRGHCASQGHGSGDGRSLVCKVSRSGPLPVT